MLAPRLFLGARKAGVMSACPQCGTIAKPTDKFCNTCGYQLPAAAAPAPAPAQQGYGYGAQPGYPAPQEPSYAQPPPIEQMQIANPGYAPQAYAPTPAQGYPPPQASPSQYGAPPQPAYDPYAQYNPAPAQPSYGQQPPAAAYDPYAQYNPAPAAYPNPYGQQAPQQGYAQPAAPAPVYAPQPAAAPAPAPAPIPGPQAPAYDPAANVPQLLAHSLRAFLITYQSNVVGDFWPLFGGKKTVGRSNSGDTVDVPLADATISSRHAAIHVDALAGTVTVEDTQSTNGTYVNEEHIGYNGRRELKDGDKLRFGGFSTIVKIVTRL